MRPDQIIEALAERGAMVWVSGQTLRVKPVGALDTALATEIRAHSEELLALLKWEDGWPKECQEAVDRFRHPQARLYPLLGRSVQTPMGRGQLVQVFTPNAAVVLDRQPDRVTFFNWEDVSP